MRRKLIKQGLDGLTIYVPKKWTDKHNLKGGEEIEITDIEGNLLLSPVGTSKEIKTIELNAEKSDERILRTLVVNAYRTGYDKINLNYTGHEHILKTLVNKYMIGFEVFKQDNVYSIESIAEPNYDDFDKIIQKLLFIVLEIYKNIQTDVNEYISHVQKYNNFLKRCISKNIMNIDSNMFMWQFIGDLTHVAREAHHFKEAAPNLKLNSKEQELLNSIVDMLLTLQKGYLKKDEAILMSLHSVEENANKKRKEIFSKSKNPIIPHYLFSIIRATYLASSSLVGAIQVQKMKNKVF